MKKWLLLFLILIPLVLAQNDELRVRYKSPAKDILLDLTQYLGEDPYFHTKTDNVTVTIFPNGTALLSADSSFKGVEEIIFTRDLSKITENGTIIKAPVTRPIPKNITKTKVTENIISDTVQGALTSDTFDILKKGVNITLLESVNISIKDKKLFLTINDKVKVEAAIEKNTRKPEITTNILFPFETKLDEKALKFNISPFLFVIPLLAITGLAIYLRLRKRHKRHLKRKKPNLLPQIHKIERNIKDNPYEDFNILLDKFFDSYLDIEKGSTIYSLHEVLRARNIKGMLKQELFYLFQHKPKTQEELKLMLHYLKESLKELP